MSKSAKYFVMLIAVLALVPSVAGAQASYSPQTTSGMGPGVSGPPYMGGQPPQPQYPQPADSRGAQSMPQQYQMQQPPQQNQYQAPPPPQQSQQYQAPPPPQQSQQYQNPQGQQWQNQQYQTYPQGQWQQQYHMPGTDYPTAQGHMPMFRQQVSMEWPQWPGQQYEPGQEIRDYSRREVGQAEPEQPRRYTGRYYRVPPLAERQREERRLAEEQYRRERRSEADQRQQIAQRGPQWPGQQYQPGQSETNRNDNWRADQSNRSNTRNPLESDY